MNKLIIPSAGAATRFFELGKHFPKSLLPFKNKPLLLYSLEKYHKLYDEIVIVVSENQQLYKEILNYYEFKNVKVQSVSKDLKQGPATSVYCGLDGTENSITILLSDALYNVDISEIPEDSISAMEVTDFSRWCMVDKDMKFYDKPITKPPTKLAVSGIYKFSDPKLYYKISEEYISRSDESETQFSNILEIYNDEKKLHIYEHPTEAFLDFGTIEQYIQNKNLPFGRSFNNISFESNSVFKNSKLNPLKIINEGMWLKHFPVNQNLIPKLIDINIKDAEIEIDLVSGFTLRELLLYYDNSNNLWEKLFKKLKMFMNDCSEYQFNTDEFWRKIFDKTVSRSGEGENEFLDYFKKLILESEFSQQTTVFHGDLVLSNIIYEPNRENIKIFDPMGDIYGHWVYDLAKLGQCVLGNYDLIDSEMYISEKNFYRLFSTDRNEIQRLFLEIFNKEIELITPKFLYALIASLYLSLIPLHSHNSQNQKLYYQEYNYFFNLSKKER